MDANPADYVRFLGRSFVDYETDRGDRAALRIGKDAWSRHDVGTRLGVVHPGACAILSRISKAIGATSTEDLYKSTSPYTLAQYAAGPTTYFVMFAAFRDRDLDPNTWYVKDQAAAVRTCLTLRHRELKAERDARKDDKRRRRQARARNHRQAVTKYLKSA